MTSSSASAIAATLVYEYDYLSRSDVEFSVREVTRRLRKQSRMHGPLKPNLTTSTFLFNRSLSCPFDNPTPSSTMTATSPDDDLLAIVSVAMPRFYLKITDLAASCSPTSGVQLPHSEVH